MTKLIPFIILSFLIACSQIKEPKDDPCDLKHVGYVADTKCCAVACKAWETSSNFVQADFDMCVHTYIQRQYCGYPVDTYLLFSPRLYQCHCQ